MAGAFSDAFGFSSSTLLSSAGSGGDREAAGGVGLRRMGQWVAVRRRVAGSSAVCPAVNRGLVLFQCPEGRPRSPLLSEHSQLAQ